MAAEGKSCKEKEQEALKKEEEETKLEAYYRED